MRGSQSRESTTRETKCIEPLFVGVSLSANGNARQACFSFDRHSFSEVSEMSEENFFVTSFERAINFLQRVLSHGTALLQIVLKDYGHVLCGERQPYSHVIERCHGIRVREALHIREVIQKNRQCS